MVEKQQKRGIRGLLGVEEDVCRVACACIEYD